MSKAEKTKQYIVEKTAPVFNRKGFAATSLTDMVEATGLTKGSIYGNFENKDAVAIAAYRHNVGKIRLAMEASVNSHAGALNQLQAVMDFYRTMGKQLTSNGGCPLLNAATEADDTFPLLLKDVQGSFRQLAKRIAGIIEKGQQERVFHSKTNAEEYAYTFVMLIEGGILLSKTFQQQKHLTLALDRVETIIRTELTI